MGQSDNKSINMLCFSSRSILFWFSLNFFSHWFLLILIFDIIFHFSSNDTLFIVVLNNSYIFWWPTLKFGLTIILVWYCAGTVGRQNLCSRSWNKIHLLWSLMSEVCWQINSHFYNGQTKLLFSYKVRFGCKMKKLKIGIIAKPYLKYISSSILNYGISLLGFELMEHQSSVLNLKYFSSFNWNLQ